MLRDRSADEYALDWLKALCARFGLVAIELDAPPTGGRWPCEITAIVQKGFELTQQGGLISGALARAIADRRIASREADEIAEIAYAEVQLLLRLVRNVQRAAEQGVTVRVAEGRDDD
ncbi:hypothetical protein D3C87_1855400 [compost metagenome]